MAKVSWSELTPISTPSQTASVPPQGNVSWSNLTPVSQPTPQYGTSQNIVAGLASPFISAANLGAKGMSTIDQRLLDLHSEMFGGKAPQQAQQQIPQVPHTPGVAYDIGNIAGLGATQFVPGLDVMGDVGEGAAGAGALGRAGALVSKVPKFAQRAVKGGGISYATTPGTRQDRAFSSVLGGALTGIVPMAGGLLKIPARALQKSSKNIVSKAVMPLHNFIHGSIASRISGSDPENTLGYAYNNAKEAVDWDKLQPMAQEADKAQIQEAAQQPTAQIVKQPLQPLQAGRVYPPGTNREEYPTALNPRPIPPDILEKYNQIQQDPELLKPENQGKQIQAEQKLMLELHRRDPTHSIPEDLYGWDVDPESADVAGIAQKTGYNPQSYLTEAQKVLQQAHAQEASDPNTYKGISDLIQGKIDRAPASFDQALMQKKAINQMPSSWDKTTNDAKINMTRKYAHLLGSALDSNVEQNSTTPEAQNFLTDWRDQRQKYGHLQNYYTDPTKGTFSPTLKNHLENGNFEAAVDQYVPKPNEGGGSKIRQFQALVGDPDEADNALLGQFLKKRKTPTGQIDTLGLAKAIQQGKVSQALMPLLTHDEKVGLGNISHVNSIAKNVKQSNGIIPRLARSGIGAGAMAMIGKHLGLPYELVAPAAAAGAYAPGKIERVMGDRYAQRAEHLLNTGQIDKLRELSDLFDEKGTPIPKTRAPRPIRERLAPAARAAGVGTLLFPGAQAQRIGETS